MATRKVRFSINYRATLSGEIEMTPEEFESWCDRIDNAKGFDKERVADELAELAGLNMNDIDLSDDEVDEFDWSRES